MGNKTMTHRGWMVGIALVAALARRPNARKLFGFSAGGLRDTVRIAGSSPEMWTDICLANRDALLAVLGRYEYELKRMRAAIRGRDRAALMRDFERARAARERWLVKRRP